MSSKELVKGLIRRLPGKRAMFAFMRAFALGGRSIEISSGRDALQKVHPKPSYRYEHPRFRYQEPSLDLTAIVPAYNVGAYIDQCLDSILSQRTAFSFEVVVVNDGSTDDTRARVEKHALQDDRVVIIDQPNGGIAAARNIGIDYARGRALTFIDSDDFIAADYFESCMRSLTTCSSDYLTTAYLDVDDEGKAIGAGKPRSLMGTPWGRVFNRDVWADVRFPTGYLYEDTVVPYLIATRYHSAFDGVNGYCYRHRNGSITRNGKNARSLDAYWIVEELLDECRILGIDKSCVYPLTIRQCCAVIFEHRQQLESEWLLPLFAACCDLVEREFPGLELPKGDPLCDQERSLRTRNFRLWKLSGMYELLKTL